MSPIRLESSENSLFKWRLFEVKPSLLLKGDVTRHDSQRRFLAQHSVATLLQHCFKWLQHCSSIATLCCAKNRRCESSCVTSPKLPRKKLCFVLRECPFWISNFSDKCVLFCPVSFCWYTGYLAAENITRLACSRLKYSNIYVLLSK